MFCYKNSTGTVIGIIFNVIEKLNKEINILFNNQIQPPILNPPTSMLQM